METAISIQHVNKHLGKRHILKDVSLEAYTGEVFGFLGPNGAGKTTAIKLMTGLLLMEDGEIFICGHSLRTEFQAAIANIGAIVENPEMYPYMTGMQNLRQYARMRDGVTEERIREVAELVGLANRVDEKVKRYSLGMRQRLGIAQALLHNPKVLILDEPTNGLDAAGIKQLRDLMKMLAHEQGICVFVSSHMMSEMELMCDRVGIITDGVVRTVQSISDLMEAYSGGTREYIYEVDDANRAAAVLQADAKFMETCRGTTLSPTSFSVAFDKEHEKETLAAVNALLLSNGITLYSVSQKAEPHLEDAFIDLTAGDAQIQ
ncbi:MAG: ABC transporter ATP-binding protein [Lachnospiraceae bacterium]|nr:ABC transporter ATP-binding protein [Lachnospiraceae bacterium]